MRKLRDKDHKKYNKMATSSGRLIPDMCGGQIGVVLVQSGMTATQRNDVGPHSWCFDLRLVSIPLSRQCSDSTIARPKVLRAKGSADVGVIDDMLPPTLFVCFMAIVTTLSTLLFVLMVLPFLMASLQIFTS